MNASSYAPGPFAPNSIVALFGTNLARSTQAATPGGVALPLEMNYVRVYVSDQVTPLLFVSENQVNFLIPSNQEPGPARIRVVTQGLSGPEIVVDIVDNAPALFVAEGGFALATSATNVLLTPAAPAKAGDIVVIYVTGLGHTSPDFGPGVIPAFAAQVVSPSRFKVRIGNVTVPQDLIKYVGITPGWPGLYQINVVIPQGVGEDPELSLSGSVTAAGLRLPVRD